MSERTKMEVSDHRPCPICESTRSQSIVRQSFSGPAGLSPLKGYDVVICAECGAGFASGIPPQAQLDSYYRDLSKYEYQHRSGSESEEDERRLGEVAQILSGIIPAADSRIMEIGCGNGRLLAMLKEHGFTDVRGIDPSPACARTARDLYGVEVLTATIFDLGGSATSAGPVDVIIMTQVLEHIRELKMALHQVSNLLANGGILYVDVPDAGNFTARAEAPFQEFSTEHINYFSRISLANLMDACGFDKLLCESALRSHRAGSEFPVVHGAFRKNSSRHAALVYDDISENALRRYVTECRAIDEQLRCRIEQEIGQGERIIVWGTGTHTQRLLASGMLAGFDIAAYVDSNLKYQGQTLNGVPVLAPGSLIGRTEPIMISSFGFQREIFQQIRNKLKLENRVITLYERL